MHSGHLTALVALFKDMSAAGRQIGGVVVSSEMTFALSRTCAVGLQHKLGTACLIAHWQ